MATPIDAPSGAKSTTVGVTVDASESITLGLVDAGLFHVRDYDTGELAYWDDKETRPKMSPYVTGIVVATDGATTGPKGEKRLIGEGEQATVFCEGGKYFAYNEAIKAFEASGNSTETGDLFWFGCTGTEPASNPRYNDRKVYEAKFGKPTTDYPGIVEMCDQARNALKASKVDAPVAAPPANGPAQAPSAPF